MEVYIQETKWTIRVPRKLLENAKRYAREQNTTLTQLISGYLIQIPAPIGELEKHQSSGGFQDRSRKMFP